MSISESREFRAGRGTGLWISLEYLMPCFRGGGGCLIKVFCNILRFPPDICRKMQTNGDEIWIPAHKLEGGGVNFRVKECIIARVYHSWQVYHPEEAVSYHSSEA